MVFVPVTDFRNLVIPFPLISVLSPPVSLLKINIHKDLQVEHCPHPGIVIDEQTFDENDGSRGNFDDPRIRFIIVDVFYHRNLASTLKGYQILIKPLPVEGFRKVKVSIVLAVNNLFFPGNVVIIHGMYREHLPSHLFSQPLNNSRFTGPASTTYPNNNRIHNSSLSSFCQCFSKCSF